MSNKPGLPSRRGVLRTAAAAADSAAPSLPGDLTAHRSPYLNWAGENAHPGLWT